MSKQVVFAHQLGRGIPPSGQVLGSCHVFIAKVWWSEILSKPTSWFTGKSHPGRLSILLSLILSLSTSHSLSPVWFPWWSLPLLSPFCPHPSPLPHSSLSSPPPSFIPSSLPLTSSLPLPSISLNLSLPHPFSFSSHWSLSLPPSISAPYMELPVYH